jgi:MYXO-CTERM domain-containing protein
MTGGVTISLTTSDGGPVPADALVCVGDICATAGAGISAAAADAGTTVTLAAIPAGTHPLTVTHAAPYADVASEVTIVPGETVTASIVLQRIIEPTATRGSGAATPIATGVPTQPGGGPSQPTGPSAPVAGSAGGVAVKALPNTGSGQDSSVPGVSIMLAAVVILMLAGAAAWRRRAS